MSILRRYIVCMLLVALALPSLAAETWLVDANNTGQPYRWPGGHITWFAEEGGFATLSAEEVTTLVRQAFAVWEKAGIKTPSSSVIGVSTAQVSSALGGKIVPVARPSAPGPAIETDSVLEHVEAKSRTIVIFDNHGEFQSNPSVAAETYMGLVNDSSMTIHSAVAVINGQSTIVKNAKDLSDPTDPSRQKLLATLIHELGHMYNLDHSVLNDEIVESSQSFDLAPNAIPTMYPDIGTPLQHKLHKDDVVAISNLYPNAAYLEQFCEIAGQVIGTDGKGYQGAHIVARPTFAEDEHLGAISAVSGNQFVENTADGTYVLRGILPGRPYQVSFSEVPSRFVNFSSVGRYGDDYSTKGELPRSGFGSGVITANGGTMSQVLCSEPGQTVVMDTIQLDVAAGGVDPKTVLLPGTVPVVPVQPTEPTTPTTPAAAGGCTLMIPRG